MSRRIDPKEYMQDGWDSSPHLAVHPYKRGSLHNKIGMWIMWIFYVIFTIQVVYALSVLPWIFPAMFGLGLLFCAYVVIKAP